MDEEKKIIEVNGVKLEIDMRYAKVISNFRIGDPVRVLVKIYQSNESYKGVIVGFDNFPTRPTIRVAYLRTEYNSAELKIVCFNSESKDIELCPIVDGMKLSLEKSRVIDLMDKGIEKKKEEIFELERQKQYFVDQFQMYFELPEETK
jgi:hypothetical protein